MNVVIERNSICIMKKTIKSKISRALGSNVDLNKKALTMKQSWDEVDHLLKSEKHNNKKK